MIGSRGLVRRYSRGQAASWGTVLGLGGGYQVTLIEIPDSGDEVATPTTLSCEVWVIRG